MKLHKNKIWILIALFTLTDFYSLAQPRDNDTKLANHYFSKGEFGKAEEYYKEAYKKYKHNLYFEKYYLCLFYQKKYDDAEKILKKKIRRDPLDIDVQFMLAQVYEETDRQEEANKLYESMIDDMGAVQSRVIALGKEFKVRGKYEYALQTYLKGRELRKRGYQFQLELAEIYSLLDQPDKMIQEYLNLLDYSSVYMKTVQTYLSRIIDFEEDKSMVESLRVELLTRIQDNPNKDFYSEMLIWFYLHQKDFMGAVIQGKAIDKRKGLNGKRLFEIAQVCEANDDYRAAKKAYEYVIEMGQTSPYYIKSVENNLNIQFKEVINQKSYSQVELLKVSKKYEDALIEIGRSRKTMGIVIQLAEIYAFYLNNPERGEALVKEALKLPLTGTQEARLKILLGDIYVVSDRIWDASLLYMQVENDFSEDVIGHEAKYKNARVFYYDGEFDYAKAQLDVLKASTSKLIANDAMQLSLLLQDNLGIDTTKAPVQTFANADLLLQQNKFDEALATLDSLEKKYPFHSIADEVLFKKAQIYERMQNWEKALELYKVVVQSYAHDILADDAAYRMAKIYDLKLDNQGKAAEYYKKILFDFKSSLYTAEARKRFTELNEVL